VANHPTDARVTVRRDTNDLLEQVMSALHEGGHALYDMGLCQEHYGTPLAQPTSYSIHESQSRFWEIQIGRSKAFSKHLLKILHTGCNSKALPQSSDELYNALNRVECSPIRTQADDCTYPLHVIVRFEIEKDLITGNLKVADLPERWNSEMEKLLGIRPKTHTEGCLQDVHWSLGSFGYFPTYTLGSLFAVCLFNAMKDAIPTLEEGIAQGQFSHIHSWLQENVWRHGRRYTSRQLILKATGKAPTENDYIAYLQAKYL
jgi:carboxypeptidase Taq